MYKKIKMIAVRTEEHLALSMVTDYKWGDVNVVEKIDEMFILKQTIIFFLMPSCNIWNLQQ